MAHSSIAHMLRTALRASSSQNTRLGHIVLTARNQQQATIYDASIKQIQQDGRLPRSIEVLCVPDPPGGNVGSGGAFLLALQALTQRMEEKGQQWADTRVLMIHAGGEGRRVPTTMPVGKLMMSVPVEEDDDRPPTLLECVYGALYPLLMRVPAGVLTVGGDVLPLLDPEAMAPLPRTEVVAFGGVAPFEQVKNHANYLVDGRRSRVLQIIQKPTHPAVSPDAAPSDEGKAIYDLGGLLHFRPAAVRRLLQGLHAPAGEASVAEHLHQGVALDQWTDLTLPLAAHTARQEYLRVPSPTLASIRAALWERLHGCALGYVDVGEHRFAHLGTLSETLDAFADESPIPNGPRPARRHFLINSLVGDDAGIGDGSWISESRVDGLSTGRRAVLQGVVIRNAGRPLPRETVLFAIPQRPRRGVRRYVLACLGLHDDLKAEVTRPSARLCGQPFSRWASDVGGLPDDVFLKVPPGQQSLWAARLFPVVEEEPAAAGLLWFPKPREATPAEVKAWRSARRLSLAEALAEVDYAHALEWREDCIEAVHQSRAAECLAPGRSVLPAVAGLQGADRRRRFAGTVLGVAESTPDPLVSARYYAGAGELARQGLLPGRGAEALDVRALDCVARACAQAVEQQALPDWEHPVRPALVLSPARVDLAGGWTDTPPQSMECGGAVVNVALTLEGRPPIAAYAAPVQEPVVSLRVLPSGREIAVRSSRDLTVPLSDPFCLMKAVLRHCWPLRDGDDALRRHLERWGRGFSVTVRSWLPHGSGLGTSSIMALAALQAIYELFGRRLGAEDGFRSVLRIEQLMSSGGGWQDQAGALVGGTKLVRTEPGVIQEPTFELLPDQRGFAEYLTSHAVLYFVGRRRTASPILREIVLRYLRGDPETAGCLETIRTFTDELWGHLRAGRWALLGPMLSLVRDVQTRLCPEMLTPDMRELIDVAAPYTRGAKMVGAGGGGFMIFTTVSPQHTRRLEDALRPRSWRGLGRRYAFAVSEEPSRPVEATPQAVARALHGIAARS